ncbi:Early transcribed membrane protein [Plasmodium coatneyi]|uniref:Early transcribed membrane protein n=1 Tax=Plasmodium coatneyi TaxID=208452 RepID=A0A1B1DWL8_9APIC|nr:Early transcribed membrane protein [Plasmodium coatneyi]ANQ07029.1 Early transcribed membrane protein [Plasmodium coatneyi]
MKIVKLLAIFAILPIVCLLGEEKVDVTPQNDDLKIEDLDINKKIKKLLHKRKLMMISVIAAAALAAGGILGGVGYGISQHRKKARLEKDEEPFTDIFDEPQPKKETAPFKMTSETIHPEIHVSIPEATGFVSPSNIDVQNIDEDTDILMETLVDEIGQEVREEMDQ